MGCANSKLDRLPAVSLCRDRCHSLEDALCQAYALADAHLAYLRSLRALGGSLGRFVSSRPPTEVNSSPRPDHGEMTKHPSSPGRSSSSSISGSHIHFNSDSDHDDHRKLASMGYRVGHVDDYYNPVELSNSNFDRSVSISYQRSQPTQSSMYIQPISDTYLNQAITAGSGLKPQQPPPPPPPPPSNSTWDFLNFFDAYSAYEQSLESSGSRRVKTFNSDMDLKSIKHETGVPIATIQKKIIVSETGKSKDEIPTAKSDKPLSINPEKLNIPESAHDGGVKDLSNVMKEVESLFEKASDSGTAVLGMLDNTTSRYRPRSCVYQVSSKVLQAISWSPANLCLKQEKKTTSSLDSRLVGSDEDAMAGSRNFTSILNKLYMWEKKLYSEVKDEEMLRVIYAKKCKELQHMIEKQEQQPGDAAIIESVYSIIKNLSTKLKISLHVVENISTSITMLRDEELCSCLCQLIHSWLEMWRMTADCHRRQCQAITEAKTIDTLSDQKRNYGFESLEEAMQVKLDLQNLELCFCKWMIAQKDCIKALDCWLTKCLSNEPEGLPSLPESEVPPVFVVSRQWIHAIDTSRVMHVMGAMRELVGTIGWLCDDSYARLHEKAPEDKDLEVKMKALERKERKMSGEIRCAIKRGVIPPTTVVGLSIDDGEHGGMSRVWPQLENMFEAMAKYSANCAETYEELCKFCDEKRVKRA